MGKAQVAVVIPVYNEQENLPELMRRLIPVMQGLKKSFEIILIDDGSHDNSLDILKSFTQHPEVKVVELTRNYGQHAAIHGRFFSCSKRILLLQWMPICKILRKKYRNLLKLWKRATMMLSAR